MFYYNKSKPFFMLSVGLFLSLCIVSCKKDDNKISVEVQTQLDQVTKVLQSNSNLVNSSVVMGQGASEKGSGGLVSDQVDDRCGSITATPADPLSFPKTLLFDYGSGCTDLVGINRAGSFILTLDKLWEPGTTSSVEYFNFVENGITMDGQLALINNSTIAGIGLSLVAMDLKRTELNGSSSTVQANLAFKQTEGILSFWDWNDDAYQITGSSQVALATGDQALFSITTPLSKFNNCAWVSKGTATLQLNGATMSIDYGDGSCDNLATVTIDGNTYTITL